MDIVLPTANNSCGDILTRWSNDSQIAQVRPIYLTIVESIHGEDTKKTTEEDTIYTLHGQVISFHIVLFVINSSSPSALTCLSITTRWILFMTLISGVTFKIAIKSRPTKLGFLQQVVV